MHTHTGHPHTHTHTSKCEIFTLWQSIQIFKKNPIMMTK
jgi:hypothetical protein